MNPSNIFSPVSFPSFSVINRDAEEHNDPMLLEKESDQSFSAEVNNKRKILDGASDKGDRKRLKTDSMEEKYFFVESYFSELPKEIRQEIFMRVDESSINFCKRISKRSYSDMSHPDLLNKVVCSQAKKLLLKAKTIIATSRMNDNNMEDTLKMIVNMEIVSLAFDEAELTANVTDNNRTYAKLILPLLEAMAENGDVEGSKASIESIPNLSERNSLYAKIVEAQIRAEDINGAEETLARMINDENKIKILHLFVQAVLVNQNDKSMIITVCTEIRESSAPTHKKNDALASLVEVLAANNYIDEAQYVMSLIHVDRIYAERSKFHALLSIAKAKAKIGDKKGSVDGFNLAKSEMNEAVERFAHNANIKASFLRKLAIEQEKSGYVTESENTAKGIVVTFEKRLTFITLAKIRAENNDIPGALQILNLAIKAALKITDADLISQISKEIKEIQIECSDADGAEKTLEKFRLQLNVCKNNASGITKDLNRFKVFKKIAVAQYICGDKDGSMETFELAKAIFTSLKPGKNKTATHQQKVKMLGEMSLTLAKMDLMEESMFTVNQIENPYEQVKAISDIYKTLLESKRSFNLRK